MLTVDYKPLASGGGADVVTQAAYLALLAGGLANGYVTGVALSEQVNKTFRQATVGVAGLANFVANALNQDVLDDGNVAALANQIALAVLKQSSGYALDTGAANAYVVALSPAIASYTDLGGLTVRFRAANACTGASTLNAGGGVLALRRPTGAALIAGDIPINGLVQATLDTVAGYWVLNAVQSVLSVAGKTGTVTLVSGDVVGDAPIASPTFTGVPAAPTAALHTNTTQLATTAFVINEIAARFYNSSPQAIVADGTITLAHGLAHKPLILFGVLTCLTAEHGYSVGDVVPIPVNASNDGNNSRNGVVVVPDASNLNVKFYSGDANVINGEFSLILRGGSSTSMKFVTNASWTISFYAVDVLF